MIQRSLLKLNLIFATFSLGLFQKYDFQLPLSTRPVKYDLSIDPDLDNGTYAGKVDVQVKVDIPTYSVVMHSKRLQITEARLNDQEAQVSTYAPYDFLILSSPSILSVGTHRVTIRFGGDMKNKTYGFFRGYEIEKESGKKVYFGVTFFEPINARTTFPCFDEPKFKARFSVSITKPPGYVAVSNMNEIDQTLTTDGKTLVRFGRSPPMSTYLVLFFVGNYSYVESFYTKRNNEVVPVRVYSPPNKIANSRFASEEMPKWLDWFVNYTGYDFMLPKLDYITFDEKFHVIGGMENWGATTTLEDSIFYNNKMADLAQGNSLNIAHEFSHIWFGDLVTTSSWGEMWLNEGFARFMDIKANSHFNKKHKDILHDTQYTIQPALWRDDETLAKPLSWELKRPTDAYNILNNINYEKGGAILTMVEDITGKDLMQRAIRKYITKFQYRNVISQNIVDVLQDFVTFNASDFLDDFIYQNGYPLVEVLQLQDKLRIILTQRRFLRYGQHYKEGRWTIPIKYTTNLERNKPEVVWFNNSINSVELQFPTNISWIKLNYKQLGYYRTNYPLEMWNTFKTNIELLDFRERANLIDDSVALVRAGKLRCETALSLMSYLRNEVNYKVWNTAGAGFRKIQTGLVQHNFSVESLQMYVSKLIDKSYSRQKWEADKYESFKEKNERKTIINLACSYGHKKCKEKIKSLWKKRNQLAADIYDVVITNDPEKQIPQKSAVNDLESLSIWFGADLNSLNMEPMFVWPLHIIENCNRWLAENAELD